ncbi:MAG: non-lysosomal glucosylceramidase [Defluviitaleaceae bacterium]|nr:non-lysosomal glucosylceramidase [Defluviitaleaceae bacterium]
MTNQTSKNDLYAPGPARSFPREASEAAFLLGGIGTGNVSVGARGELRDWEIFNRPNKGGRMPYTFFAIWAKERGGAPDAKILESRLTPPYHRSGGYDFTEMAGVPRFESSVMTGEYPFVKVGLIDGGFPVQASLEAFTPLIPLDVDNSSLPAAVLRYSVTNTRDEDVEVSIIGSLANVAGLRANNVGWFDGRACQTSQNEPRAERGLTGVFFNNPGTGEKSLDYGDLCLAARVDDPVCLPFLNSGPWCDGFTLLWEDFSRDGRLDASRYENVAKEAPERFKLGVIGGYATLKPGETKDFLFILSWRFPNRINNWYEGKDTAVTQNYYAGKFKDSWETALYLHDNMAELERGSENFRDAIFCSSLPWYVKDAVAANVTVLRSTTCFRLISGKFFGWEGCNPGSGCCDGNCTHVWNYAHTLAFLFPELERDMRLTEFNVETDETGKMQFRSHRLFGEAWDFHPAADGQFGCIIRLCRDWKLCGDMDFLAAVWPNAKKALDYAFTYWDSDGDFVLDTQQHNTYDIEFYGPNSLVNSMFYAALKAGAEMAAAMGDAETSRRYADALEKGSRRMDELLWNGSYYIQKIGDVNAYKYQYGKGCLSDQLFGQLQAHVSGVGYVLPEEHVKNAIREVFRHNFRTDFHGHTNLQRTYALNEDQGLILCSWPEGGRPDLPFVYSDEVWTGIEYQVAAHLIFEGAVEEGLTIVKATRERHDGFRRNPWNEAECGNHYVRSMASWGVLIALSGFRADLVKKEIHFAPATEVGDFSCFFSCAAAWGVFSRKVRDGKTECSVKVLGGGLEGIKVFADGEEVCCIDY